MQLVASEDALLEMDGSAANLARIKIRILLNDLTATGTWFFAHEKLEVDQWVIIHFEDPQKVSISAKVLVCQEYQSEGHIVSADSHPFRGEVQFIFETKDIEKEVKRFCELVASDYLFGSQKAA